MNVLEALVGAAAPVLRVCPRSVVGRQDLPDGTVVLSIRLDPLDVAEAPAVPLGHPGRPVCDYCGSVLAPDAAACPNCGAPPPAGRRLAVPDVLAEAIAPVLRAFPRSVLGRRVLPDGAVVFSVQVDPLDAVAAPRRRPCPGRRFYSA